MWRTLYTDVLLSSRYDLVTQNKNWDDAQVYCQTHYRAKLVVIADSTDQLRLQAFLETINGIYSHASHWIPCGVVLVIRPHCYAYIDVTVLVSAHFCYTIPITLMATAFCSSFKQAELAGIFYRATLSYY